MRKNGILLVALMIFSILIPLVPLINSSAPAILPAELPLNNNISYSTSTINYEWWNSSWNYRVRVEINSTVHSRFDQMIELMINFTELFETLDVEGSLEFDNYSIRVVEYNSTGKMIPFNSSKTGSEQYVVPSLFDPVWNYDASTNARGEVVWIMNGTTLMNQNRTYFIYFDLTSNGPKAASPIQIKGTDFDGDLNKDIIFGGNNGEIWMFDGPSKNIKRTGLPKPYEFYSGDLGTWDGLGTALADVDNDGDVELIACDYNYYGSNNGAFWVFGYNSSADPDDRLITEFHYPQGLGGHTHSITAADVDNDGVKEIIVTVWNPTYRIMIFGWNGSTYIKEGETLYMSAGIIPIAIGDVDQDGILEIVGGRWDYTNARFYVYGYTGTSYEVEYSSDDMGYYVTGIVIGNIDTDNNIEIVVGTRGDYSYGSTSGSLYIYEYVKDGGYYRLEYRHTSPVGYYVMPGDIADWDNDGVPEIAVGTYRQAGNVDPGQIIVYNYTGGVLMEEWRADTSAATLGLTERRFNCPRFSDVDGDGVIELIDGSEYGFIRIWNSTNTVAEYTSSDMGTYIADWFDDALIISGERTYRDCPTLITPPEISLLNPEIKTATLTVRTLDVDNNAIPNAHVYFDNGTFIRDAITDETGTCTFKDFSEGIYNITVTYTTTVNPSTSYTITINYTMNLNIVWTTSDPTLNISCDMARFIFNVTDIDQAPVNSGWLLIGNSSMILDNITLDANGLATFRWINSSNILYNFSVYYNSPGYVGSPLLVNSSTILNTPTNRTTVQSIKTNLTTCLIQLLDENYVPLEGATVRIRDFGNITNLVDLETDSSGLTTFRWKKADYPRNYTLFVYIREIPYLINETLSIPGNPNWKYSFNFTLSNRLQYQPNLTVIVQWNTSNYISNLYPVNPSVTITTYKNSNVTLQVQFNTTDLQNSVTTPTSATQCTYSVWDSPRTTKLDSGTLTYLSWGRHSIMLNTTDSIYSSNSIYYVDIDAFKTGYQKPSTVTFTIILTDTPTELTADKGVSSAIQAIWTEIHNVSLTYNGVIPESVQIGESTIRLSNQTGNITINTYITALTNYWNLTGIAFNFSNIYTTAGLVQQPTGISMNVTYKGKHYSVINTQPWHGYCEIPASDLNLYEILYSYGVEGVDLTNYSVTITARFRRFFAGTVTLLSNTNETNIVIDGTNDYRNINYLKFEFSNIRDMSDSLINATDAKMNITLPDNLGSIVSVSDGSEPGTGILELTGLNLYPTNSFHFLLNYTNVKSYDCYITAGLTRVFDMHFSQEKKTTQISYSHVTASNTINVSMPINQWDLTSLFLEFSNLKKTGTGEKFFPSENNLIVIFEGHSYEVSDLDNGSGSVQIPVSSSDGNSLFSFLVRGTEFDFTYDLQIAKSYSNDIVFPLSNADVSWVAEIPTVSGICPENESSAGTYILTFDTTQLDAGEWGASSGNHYLSVTATKTGYDSESLTVTFDVRKVETTLNGSKTNYDVIYFTVTYGNNITYYYEDEFGVGIENADVLIYEWESSDNPNINGTGTLIEIGNGYYILDLDTEYMPVGGYDISLEISKNNYRSKIAGIHLNITTISTVAEPDQNRLEPEQGQTVTFIITYNDTIKGVLIPNATYVVTGLPSGSYTIVENPAGYYTLTVDTNLLALTTYDIRVTLSKDNYTSKEVNLLLIVKEKTIFGIPMSWFFIIIGTVAATVTVFAAYAYVKKARIPYVIKKIDETLKIIEKNKPSAAVPVTKMKHELFTNIFKEEWNIIGLTPPTIGKEKGLNEFMDLLLSTNVKLSQTEAQKLMMKLKPLSKEEGIALLRDMGIPPDMCERLYHLAKVGEEFKGVKL